MTIWVLQNEPTQRKSTSDLQSRGRFELQLGMHSTVRPSVVTVGSKHFYYLSQFCIVPILLSSMVDIQTSV